MQGQIPQRSTNSLRIDTGTKAHNIHMGHGELVVTAVQRVAQAVQVRASTGGAGPSPQEKE